MSLPLLLKTAMLRGFVKSAGPFPSFPKDFTEAPTAAPTDLISTREALGLSPELYHSMGPADIREHVKKRRDAELMDGAKTPISQALQGILPGVGIGALATALSHLILAKHLRPSVGHGALMGGSIGAYRGYTEGERKRKFFESLQDPKALEAVVQTFDRDRLT